MAVTVPGRVDSTGISVFMDSTTTTGSPGSTVVPTSATTFQTTPVTGDSNSMLSPPRVHQARSGHATMADMATDADPCPRASGPESADWRQVGLGTGG